MGGAGDKPDPEGVPNSDPVSSAEPNESSTASGVQTVLFADPGDTVLVPGDDVRAQNAGRVLRSVRGGRPADMRHL